MIYQACNDVQLTYNGNERPPVPPPRPEPEQIDCDRDFEEHERKRGRNDALQESSVLKFDQITTIYRIQVFSETVLCLKDEN